MNNRSGYMKAS